jgi:D-3-phosphoglycerate dehydrogenase
VTRSHDRPGFIGRVGTLLGAHGLNIATWRTGRDKPGGLAISFIGVDSDVPDKVIDILRSFELVLKITKVKL